MTGRERLRNKYKGEMKMERKRKSALYTIAPTIIFVISFLMFYKETFLVKNSDITTHMQYALSLDRVFSLTHCGWHFVCWLFYACLPISIAVAAALSTALFNAWTAYLVIWLADKYLKDKVTSIMIPTITTVSALLAGPLYLRFYNANYYKGQGSPNVWHNPTTIAVRPFMILITVMTVEYWNCDKEEKITLFGKQWKKTTIYQWVMMFLLFFSTLIKPSYLMVYMPVCGIVALVRLLKGKGKNFLKLVVQHLYFIPAAVVLFWQYLEIYLLGTSTVAGEGGIEIAFFKVARLYASSVTVSLILKMAFPFLVLLLFRKIIFKDKYFQLIFGQFLVGLAETWTLAETGKRAKHGNFGWGNILAASFVWIFCLIFYVKEVVKNKDRIAADTALKVKYGIPAAVLAWHLLAGICYYVSLLTNMKAQL